MSGYWLKDAVVAKNLGNVWKWEVRPAYIPFQRPSNDSTQSYAKLKDINIFQLHYHQIFHKVSLVKTTSKDDQLFSNSATPQAIPGLV